MVPAEVLSCLDNAESLQIVDLNELSVTLDIFVLTLPPEIEVMADFHHNRYIKSHEKIKMTVTEDLLLVLVSFDSFDFSKKNNIKKKSVHIYEV